MLITCSSYFIVVLTNHLKTWWVKTTIYYYVSLFWLLTDRAGHFSIGVLQTVAVSWQLRLKSCESFFTHISLLGWDICNSWGLVGHFSLFFLHVATLQVWLGLQPHDDLRSKHSKRPKQKLQILGTSVGSHAASLSLYFIRQRCYKPAKIQGSRYREGRNWRYSNLFGGYL